MRYKHRLITIFIMLSGITMFTQAHAGDFVTGDKLASLVINKTVRAKHLKKDFEFSIYFDKDGKTAFRKKRNGEIVKTTYRFDGNKHCLFWKGKDRCASIKDNGDGTYSRINDSGNEVVKWTKLEVGKNL
ncbi:MAG: hypothetical protein OEY52_06000 [Gammaproteobacteria bacterium]|nr:hypothetical protein [Gammaproteobacteria bacterium]